MARLYLVIFPLSMWIQNKLDTVLAGELFEMNALSQTAHAQSPQRRCG